MHIKDFSHQSKFFIEFNFTEYFLQMYIPLACLDGAMFLEFIMLPSFNRQSDRCRFNFNFIYAKLQIICISLHIEENRCCDT